MSFHTQHKNDDNAVKDTLHMTDMTCLLPHRPPFLFVDSVAVPSAPLTLENGDMWPAREYIMGSYTVQAHNPFVREDRVLEPIAYAEMMAQCAGALGLLQGIPTNVDTQPALGYLAALRDVRTFGTHGLARVGDVLTVYVRCTASVGQISVVEGYVFCNHKCLAAGQCKIFVEGA